MARSGGRRKRGQGGEKIGEGDLFGFQSENVLKGVDGFLLHFFQRYAPAKERGEGNDLDAFETARVDHVIV
ncbi:MAG: hypothetical protein H6R37_1414, partial [Deltaproteobacteria bacterium]|nr:hypothetical protein [Deltaproteobacteria bacterium]